MIKKTLNITILLIAVFLLSAQQSFAQSIKLNSPTILGSLNLSSTQLKSIKKAAEKAMGSSIDAEQQCGEVKGDCVVRAAREWKYQGSTFREIVVNIHTVGHASFTVEKAKGKKWPTIAAK